VDRTLDARRATYYTMSTRLALADNAQLTEWLGELKERTWGSHTTIKVAGTRVFVKRIPMTELEHADMFSTRNLYDLPTYYNYGVGSAGFGAFRELVTHIKTTNWVLEGSIDNFPLLYHYRIAPRPGRRPRTSKAGREQHEGYVRYWNSNENIGEYMIAREKAKYEVVLFLEHFPHVLDRWLGRRPETFGSMTSELMDVFTFLRENGVIHFDAHLWNVVTDGKRPYLTDFGLVLDRGFDLSADERAFYRRNTHYDPGLYLCCLGWVLARAYRTLGPRKKARAARNHGVAADAPEVELLGSLFDNLDAMQADGTMGLGAPFVQTVQKHRDIIEMMCAWMSDLGRNDRKDSTYSHAKLKRLLAAGRSTD